MSKKGVGNKCTLYLHRVLGSKGKKEEERNSGESVTWLSVPYAPIRVSIRMYVVRFY